MGIVTAGEQGVMGSKVCVRLFLSSVYVCVCVLERVSSCGVQAQSHKFTFLPSTLPLPLPTDQPTNHDVIMRYA